MSSSYTLPRMRNFLLVVTLIAPMATTASAETAHRAPMRKGIAVAFYDEVRLRNTAGVAALEDFKYFFRLIQPIVDRDFPGVELRVLARGELLHLPDGTGLNVDTLHP